MVADLILAGKRRKEKPARAERLEREAQETGAGKKRRKAANVSSTRNAEIVECGGDPRLKKEIGETRG